MTMARARETTLKETKLEKEGETELWKERETTLKREAEKGALALALALALAMAMEKEKEEQHRHIPNPRRRHPQKAQRSSRKGPEINQDTLEDTQDTG